jgi:hypothetical protein
LEKVQIAGIGLIVVVGIAWVLLSMELLEEKEGQRTQAQEVVKPPIPFEIQGGVVDEFGLAKGRLWLVSYPKFENDGVFIEVNAKNISGRTIAYCKILMIFRDENGKAVDIDPWGHPVILPPFSLQNGETRYTGCVIKWERLAELPNKLFYEIVPINVYLN